ncbi:MAG: hypothetical protein AAFX40_02345 [Cyanobacteria bacterium J06639_1]
MPNRRKSRKNEPVLTLSERLNIAFVTAIVYALFILLWIPVIVFVVNDPRVFPNTDRGQAFFGILLILTGISGAIGFHLKPRQVAYFFSIMWMTDSQTQDSNETFIQVCGLTLLGFGFLAIFFLFTPFSR